MLCVSWGRWGAIFVDTYRDLYAVEQMLSGERLYTDIAYEYGFAAPYVMKVWGSTWGWTSLSYAWLCVVVFGLASWATYKVLRMFCARSTAYAWLSLGAAASLCPCYVPNYQVGFVFPYSFAMILFIALAVWAVFLTIRLLRGGGRRCCAALIGVFFCAVCVRYDMGLFLLIGCLCAAIIMRASTSKVCVWCCVAGFVAGVSAIISYVCCAHVNAADFFFLITGRPSEIYLKDMFGVYNWSDVYFRKDAYVISSVFIGLFAIFADSGSVAQRISLRGRRLLWVLCVGAGAYAFFERSLMRSIFEVLPLTIAVLLAKSACRGFRRRDQSVDDRLRKAVLTCCLCCVWRQFGNVDLVNGLTAAQMPFFVVMAGVFFSGLSGRKDSSVLLVFLFACALSLGVWGQGHYVFDGNGENVRLLPEDERSRAVPVVSREIEEGLLRLRRFFDRVPEHKTLTVVPEGDGVHWALRRRAGGKLSKILPLYYDISQAKGIELGSVSTSDYLLVVQRDYPEYGERNDYVCAMKRFVESRYDKVDSFGDQTYLFASDPVNEIPAYPHFAYALYERKRGR
jgi:hypothetical protein